MMRSTLPSLRSSSRQLWTWIASLMSTSSAPPTMLTFRCAQSFCRGTILTYLCINALGAIMQSEVWIVHNVMWAHLRISRIAGAEGGEG